MFILDGAYEWCYPGSGIVKAMSFIKSILNIIRWVVPIGLILFTTYEVIKKVINPDEKDPMKHIVNRIIAAVVVFFVPVFVRFALKIIDIGAGNDNASKMGLGKCWDMAYKEEVNERISSHL
ncbi:MAG: hypothetical protein J6X02_02985 [Bacilli bacterium]|nr:hypothetical protein [Bacilli bacterium]